MTHGMAEIEIEIEILETEVERAEAQAHEFESEAIHNDEIMQSLAAEVTALKARIAELEAGAQWRPASEPPKKLGQYLGCDGYDIQIVEFLPGDVIDGEDWPWYDRDLDEEVPITYWMPIRPLPDPPTEAPAP